MDISGKKLLVIGGAGLIGSHTVDQLCQEDVKEIVVFDNFVRGSHANLEKALKDPRVKIFEAGGDITQTDLLEKAMEGVDGVFHFAALWLLQCLDYPRYASEVNIQGTFNVLEACVKAGVQKLVYSSSASVYGDAIEEPMKESHPFNNTTFYGATKIAGEAMLTAFNKRYNLPCVGLRYMNVFGPRQDYRGAYIAVIMKMLDSISRGEPMCIYGDGSQSYDFVYVGDCANANIKAMKSETTHGFYNVGTGTKTSILELAKILQSLTGTKDNIKFFEAGQSFVLNRVGCPEAAERDLGFKATADLTEGLIRLIEWRNSRHMLEAA
jgi:UDP-glucose 4-epimerase